MPTIFVGVNSVFTDTIAAIATASGAAGIAVIRLSGSASLSIADAIVDCAGMPPSQRPGSTFVHGRIVTAQREIDEAIVLVFRAPHSYTREDVIEIQCHGGTAAAQRLLQTVLQAGARMAAPGEFTRRAFLNGRIDLVQAEAVADLIRARSDRAAAAAIEQLEGRLSDAVNHLYDQLLATVADLEASLDFEDNALPASVLDNVSSGLTTAQNDIQQLLDTWREGHLLRDGARVVIAGQPNVGKSTLMNCLLGKARSIVTHLPGTTRDTIEETLVLGGIAIRLIDTAGLRNTSCLVERQGVTRATDSIQQADLVLYLVDASPSVIPVDQATLDTLDPQQTIIVQNKCDLINDAPSFPDKRYRTVACSATQQIGIETLRHVLRTTLGQLDTPPHAVISERHYALLHDAHGRIGEASRIAAEDESLLVPAVDLLRNALDMLGTITGRTYTAELLDTIFSRFCIGK